MKNKFSKLFPLLLVTVLAPSLASATGYEVKTFSKSTNIRSKANPKASIVTKVPAGTKLRILARNNETDVSKLWLKVETDKGKQGWVAAKVTKFVKPAMMSGSTDSGMGSGDTTTTIDSGTAPAPAAPMDTEAPSAAPAPSGDAQPAAPSTDEIPDIEILDSTDAN